MRWLNQTMALTFITLRTIPQRLGTSLVVVIGITGVVGVLVSVLAMSEVFATPWPAPGATTASSCYGLAPTPSCPAVWSALR